MYSTSLTASFCVCLPSTLTYALLLLLLSLSLSLLLLLLCVFGKESRHQAKFVCLFDFGYSGGFGFGFGQEAATAVHASSRLGLTIIVNLAYGFFIVASVSLPPSSSRSSWPQIIFTANTALGSLSQSVSPSVASALSVIKSNYTNYYLIIIGTGQVAQLPSCPGAQWSFRYRSPLTCTRYTDTQTIIIGCGCSKCPQVVTIFSKQTHNHMTLCGICGCGET